MIRLIGAEAGRVDPRRLRVAVSAAGKPALAEVPNLQVSISHTASVVAVAACWDVPVGVDIEGVATAPADPRRLARRLFSSSEADTLDRMADDDVNEWFMNAWTIKESVGKALGVGMVPALSGVVVEGRSDALRLAHVWRGPPADGWTLHQVAAPHGSERITIALSERDIALQPIHELTLDEFVSKPSTS